jgi:RNA-binding protein YlmH
MQTAVRVLDTAADALKTWELRATDFFLTPPEYTVMLSTLEGLVDLQATAWGGHPEVYYSLY